MFGLWDVLDEASQDDLYAEVLPLVREAAMPGGSTVCVILCVIHFEAGWFWGKPASSLV